MSNPVEYEKARAGLSDRGWFPRHPGVTDRELCYLALLGWCLFWLCGAAAAYCEGGIVQALRMTAACGGGVTFVALIAWMFNGGRR